MIRIETHIDQKTRCSDCLQCQFCGETRCRICRGSRHHSTVSELDSGFTYGEYLAWKKRRFTAQQKNMDLERSEDPGEIKNGR